MIMQAQVADDAFTIGAVAVVVILAVAMEFAITALFLHLRSRREMRRAMRRRYRNGHG
jgi:hypothetical protein